MAEQRVIYIRTNPVLAKYLETEAERLGMTVNKYVSMLLWIEYRKRVMEK